MKQLLLPWIGAADPVVFIGQCKNAGKTTALCRLIAELPGERLALTSIGRDGESTDLVTGTAKPSIWVPSGTLFATARKLLPLCDVTVEVLQVTDVATPLGQVAVFRALSDGTIQLAGPSSVPQLKELTETFRTLGCDRILLDGAAGRKSLAAVGQEGCAVLCTGAAGGSLADVVAETAHTCALFATPAAPWLSSEERFALFTPEGETLELALDESGQPNWAKLPGEPCVLWMAGGVTNPILRVLSQRGTPITLAVPDATHILADRAHTEPFLRRGGSFLTARKLTIAAVCANPWSPRGDHLPREAFLSALREAIPLPVVDVKEGEPWT